MAFHHRKLIFESLDNSTAKTKTCSSYYCNPNEKHSGICPISCIYICYPTCSIPFLSEIQPPVPPISATPVLPQSIHYKPTVSNLSIILISFLATCFFIFCCYTAYRFRRSRISRRQQQAEEEEEEQEFSDIVDEDMVDHPIWYIRTIGLQPSVISAITICKYKRGEGLIEGTVCSVCLNEFQQDETLRILPKCNHAFHMPCIDTWLRSHTNCPMCRAGILTTTAAATSPLPEQDSGLRHEEEEEEGHLGISENALEIRIGIENQSESFDSISSVDTSGNSKGIVANGNVGELSEGYTLRRSASLESSYRAWMARASSSDCWREHQNSREVSRKIDEAGKTSLYVERGEYTREVLKSQYRRSQSAALLR